MKIIAIAARDETSNSSLCRFPGLHQIDFLTVCLNGSFLTVTVYAIDVFLPHVPEPYSPGNDYTISYSNTTLSTILILFVVACHETVLLY